MKNRVKEFRAKKKMTREKFGKKLGVSRQTVIAIENGKYGPSLPLAFKISRVLGKKIECIFTFDNS